MLESRSNKRENDAAFPEKGKGEAFKYQKKVTINGGNRRDI